MKNFLRIFLSTWVLLNSAAFAHAATLDHPQVNFIPQPLGLDAVNADNLRFSWRVAQGMQTAYQSGIRAR